MLLALSFLAGFAGFDLLLAGYHGWNTSQLEGLLLGKWPVSALGPAYQQQQTGPKSSLAPGGQYLVPTNPNEGRDVPLGAPGGFS